MPYIFKKKETGAKTTVSMSAGRIAEPGIPLDVHGDVVEISDPEQHAMVIAASGRGKTRRILFPAVVLAARAGRSLVINDPKAEIYRATSNEVRRCGYEVRVLDLRNPLCGDRWSPLTLVQKYWDSSDHGRASELLSEIAEIITEKIHSDRDRYWKQAAIDVFLGFSLLVLEHGRRLTFATVHSFINEYYRETELRERFRLHIDHYADSYRRLCTVLHLDSEITLGCVVSEINSAISEFVDREDVRDLLVGADFDLTSFGKKKVAYYLVSKDESTALHSIVSLFVSQTYAELVHYADTREDNTLPTRVDFILDEFGNLFGCDWVCKLTAARSRGIRFILALQDLSQLSDKYGEHGAQALFSNCRTIVFQGGKDFRMMGVLSALSEVADESGIPRLKMSVPELAGLAMGETVILDDSGHPRRGHLPDWTARGISDRAAIATTKRVLEAVHIPSLEGIICETEGRNKRPFAEGSESETDAEAVDPESPEGRTALGNNPDEKTLFRRPEMDAVKVIKNANTVVLNGVIDDDSAAQVCLAILELEAEGSDQITLMLNSSGGSISAGWMIADTVRMCDVETICIGQACSMGAIVLMAGKKGYRSILEHGRVLLHQPLASASMQQASDFELVARELSRTKEDLYSFICKCTGRSMSQVAEDCDRDHWLNAEEARSYGIVDTIESRKTRQKVAADCDRNH